jgi:predicted RNase H-related nuclease YkuK (DUF458 family)
MDLKFKSLTNRKEVDLIPYIQNFFANNENTILYIGCDSQNIKISTVYAIVVVLYNMGKGGHVLYSRINLPRIPDRFTRLWKEVEYSVEIAEYLREQNIQKPAFIDIDLNPDPKYQSNQLLRAALGYVEGMGYKVRCKPYSMVASHVADALCK